MTSDEKRKIASDLCFVVAAQAERLATMQGDFAIMFLRDCVPGLVDDHARLTLKLIDDINASFKAMGAHEEWPQWASPVIDRARGCWPSRRDDPGGFW